MQAIITKYIPATNHKPSRIKASCERGSLTMSYDQALNDGEAHRAVCDALCARFDAEDRKNYGCETDRTWSRAKASGQIPSGEYVFCFIADRVLKRGGFKMSTTNPTVAESASVRISAAIAAIGTNRTPARYYAESDGDPHTRTFYVCHTHGRPRIDCASMAEARELAHSLNAEK